MPTMTLVASEIKFISNVFDINGKVREARIFNSITFDVPVRKANYKITKEYNSEFFKGMFSGKHLISSDQKGYRTNKKINYTVKNENILRIFTIGASTTEQGSIDDQKTWSNLLSNNLQKFTEKKVEIINTGMAGLRAEHHYFTFKRIKKYSPDLVIFLMGINDWNHDIINNEKKYLIPKYEIAYDFKKSILYKTFSNIDKQIGKKIINRKKIAKQNIIVRSPEQDTEAYLLPQINSLNKRAIIKNLELTQISQNYKYWLNLIIDECEKNKSTCLFLDQPTAYKKNISSKE